MKICIDATPILGMRAIRRIVQNLILEITRQGKENEYLFFYIIFRYGLNKVIDVSDAGNLKNVICRLPARILFPLWQAVSFPSVGFFTGRVDLFHALDHYGPPFRGTKYIQTIHGLHHIVAAEYMEADFIARQEKYFHRMQRRVDHFITVSEKTKSEILHYIGVDEKRVDVIPLGVEGYFEPLSDPVQVRRTLKEKFSVENPYILYVGGIDPWKNVLSLIASYALLVNKKKVEYNLLLVGPVEKQRKGYFEKVKQKVLELGLVERVKWLGYVTDSELVDLYNGADAFVFLSLYEGWTSPPLEAMKCGCPVVTSNVSSLPETVGDAALKVNPYDPEEIADAVERVLTDSDLRKTLIEKGLKRASQFTWEKMAKAHLEVYKKVANF